LKKPGYHPARLHNGKSHGFLNSLLKDKVAPHPNGGEILNGRAQRCVPAPEPARATGSHPGVSFSIRHGRRGHPSPTPVTTAVAFAPFCILMSYSPWTYFLSAVLMKKKRILPFFCFNFVAGKKRLPHTHM
jgi:hypothetical protein